MVAGPSGAVRSIRFEESALSKGTAALSRLTTTTFQQAVARAARQQAALVQRYTGDPTIAEKVNSLRQELANPPEGTEGFRLASDEPQRDLTFAPPADVPAEPTPRHRPPAPGPRHARLPEPGTEDEPFEFRMEG